MVEKSDWLSDDEQEEGEEVLQTGVVATSASLFVDSSSQQIIMEEEHKEHEKECGSNDVHNSSGNRNTEDGAKNDDSSSSNTDTNFEVGDHIYSWCSFLGFPFMFTHHGIVINRDDSAGMVTILDFSCLMDDSETNNNKITHKNLFSTSLLCQSSTTGCSVMAMDDGKRKPIIDCSSSKGGSGNHNKNDSILRSYAIEESNAKRVWRKVKYNASVWETYVISRAGTVSRGNSDPVQQVLARTEYLMTHHSHLLSTYDLTKSNCEHVAVWCKTGYYSSLQVLSGMNQALVFSTVPTIAASTATTTVASTGLWGYLGYTTVVPLASVMGPWFIPITCVPAAVSAGKSALDRKQWRIKTDLWNTTFDEWWLEQQTNIVVAVT